MVSLDNRMPPTLDADLAQLPDNQRTESGRVAARTMSETRPTLVQRRHPGWLRASTHRTRKKAGVGQHLGLLPHAGLLSNEPPASSGLSFIQSSDFSP